MTDGFLQSSGWRRERQREAPDAEHTEVELCVLSHQLLPASVHITEGVEHCEAVPSALLHVLNGPDRCWSWCQPHVSLAVSVTTILQSSFSSSGQTHHRLVVHLFYLKGVVWDVGHGTSCPSEPGCYLSLETVFNTFHSVLLVAENAGARLVQVKGIC